MAKIKSTSSSTYKGETLSLFFIVSLVPALFVGAIWYGYTKSTHSDSIYLSFHSLVLPVMALGVLPAILLSFLFAELLHRPVRRLQDAAREISNGNLSPKALDELEGGEFGEIAAAFHQVALKLEQSLSQAVSETALIEAERNKLRGVLNSMSDGVFALDGSGRVILFNKAAIELTGRKIGEVAGQLAEKVMPFRSGGELIMTRWLADQEGTGHHIGEWKSLELYRADGTSLFVDVQAATLHEDPNGIRTLITFHDLTKGHQLEEMKIDFIALAAHELRTPVTEIRGALDILASDAKITPVEDVKWLTHATNSAEELSRLINNLLEVSRIEHGSASYDPEPVNYTEYLKEIVADTQRHIVESGRTFEFDVPTRLPKIPLDHDAIKEVLGNLLGNAMIHTPSGTNISITVKRVEDTIQTLIHDTGDGIPAKAVPNLFTKFYRAGEMKSKTRGTGLGLYISRTIIEAHGGKIWAESTVGEGSTFGFSLPIKSPVAHVSRSKDNKTNNITRGAHGWIKTHTIR